MSFDESEISNEVGTPVYLYEVRLGNTTWRYTSADQGITLFAGSPEEVTYLAHTITDEGTTQGGSDENDMQISVRSDSPLARLFQGVRPSGKVWATIRSYHFGDPDEETPIEWIGTLTNTVLVDRATVQINGRSIGGTYDRNGLRLVWSRTCPHALYGTGCFVDKTLHSYEYVIDTLTGTNFTIVEPPVDPDPEAPAWTIDPVEGSFSGGFMEWLREDGSIERRGIEEQTGNDFRVFGTTEGMEVGLEVTLYPGCARNTTVCKLFDNLPNYGGFPHLPGKSPFDGTPVF